MRARRPWWITALLVVAFAALAAYLVWLQPGDQEPGAGPATTPPPAAAPTPTAPPEPGAATGAGSGWPAPPDDAQRFTVEYVHDGDTLFLDSAGGAQVAERGRIKVRLIGIDSPEVTEPVECYGRQATAELREILREGDSVLGAIDAEGQDHYGRWLLYLWTTDGYFVNAGMVDNGYAEAIRVRPNDGHWPLLRSLAANAQRDRVGLWGACG